jgi:hypothetical protein
MKPNALFPILFIQNNLLKKKNQVPTFFIRLLHSVHFREILSGYFLFSRFDWSIFVPQLVAKHMKEIIILKMTQISSETAQFEHFSKINSFEQFFRKMLHCQKQNEAFRFERILKNI